MPAGRIVLAGRANRNLSFKQVKQVQKLINADKRLKTVWLPIAGTMSTSKSLHKIAVIAEGDDFDQRTGDRVKAVSMRFQWCITPTDTTLVTGDVRVMVVRATTDVLASADMPAYNGAPDLDKMQVYYDEVINLSNHEFDPISRSYFKSFKNKKIPHLNIHFDDDESATEASKNPLYLFYTAQTASNATISGH